MRSTRRYTTVRKWVPEIRKFRVPKKALDLLDSGKVFFVLEGDGSICWPYFPIHRRRIIVKYLRRRGVAIPHGTKVIVEIDPSADTARFIHDCLGHVLLYLRNPKLKNECRYAAREMNRYAKNRTRR